MGEFGGGRAAIQSIQFVFNHFSAFLKLTATWAVLTLAPIVLYCLIAKPAGPDADFVTQLALAVTTKSTLRTLLQIIPTLLGELALAVVWIQFVLTGKEPVNPLRLPIEMVPYFIRGLGLTIIVIVCALPGTVLSFAIPQLLPAAAYRGVFAAVIVLLVAVPVLVTFARLCVVLPVAAVDETLTFGDAYERTKGHSVSLSWGLFVAYMMPLAAFSLADVLLSVMGPHGVKQIGAEIVRILSSFTLTIIPAGYFANVYRAFMPGDAALIAKQFE